MKEVKELEFDKEVLKKIEMICRFACIKPIIKQGSVINIKGTNIAYVSPHIITIKENNYLIFNGSDTLFVNDYSKSFSLPEQEKRLKAMCEYKGYEIYKVYKDAGISAKIGNHRPAFEELKEDIKAKKCNTIVVLKLDRLTRSVYDWENIMKFLEENNAYLDCANDDINMQMQMVEWLLDF